MNRFQIDVIARNALEAIIQERIRQTLVEGHTPAHDDEHTEGQLALLAAAYALSSRGQESGRAAGIELTNILAALDCWKWHFKPKDPIRDLTRAGALILAELERLLRAENPVSKAIAEGKLQEGQRTWAQNLLDRDPAGFQRYIGDVDMSELRPRMTHELKTWPEFFEQTRNGRKKFELRCNDRDFRVGDELRLQEWNPVEGRNPGGNGVGFGYTGRELLVRVDYIMDSQTLDRLMNRFQDGAQMSGYVIISISHVN